MRYASIGELKLTSPYSLDMKDGVLRAIGEENHDGFNHPLPKEKIEIINISRNNYMKKYKQFNLYALCHTFLIGAIYLFCILTNINKQYITYIAYFVLFLFIPIIMIKKPNRGELIWIDFLLARNKELIANKNYKNLKWKNMLF